ncbi:hypothetical protein [Microbacterium aurum]
MLDAVSVPVTGNNLLDGFWTRVGSSDSVGADVALGGTLVLCLVVAKVASMRRRSRH